MSTPWHPLNETFSKVIVSNGHLHLLVSHIGITMTQQHHLVVVGEVVVRNGDGRRTHDSVNEAIRTIRE